MVEISEADNPHMVMLVGNHVVGDSRVEKAAQSALRSGYKVTIVGILHRSVHKFGSTGRIPVLRATPEYVEYNKWLKKNRDLIIDDKSWRNHRDALKYWNESSPERVKKVEYKSGRGRLTRKIKWVRPAVSNIHVLVEKLRPAPSLSKRQIAQFHHAKRVLQVKFTSSTSPNSWRKMWPQIEDLETAFLETLVELKPDIIHVHDRHPMSAADKYAEKMAGSGKHVPWVYDAHEWLPGQFFSGPPNHKTAWLAAEMELIQRANSVVTVSDQLALKMRARHGLPSLPRVVVNAPSQVRVPMPPSERRQLRVECGLDDSTPLLVYVGKLAERRGIFDVVRTLQYLPEYHLAFVASKDPTVRVELTKLALELGVSTRLHIHDYVPAASVTWYISSADIGLSPLHPTPAHHSALPTKIREYLHAGLPIVASELRAQSKFIDKTKIGVLHLPKNPQNTANAISQVYDNLSFYQSSINPTLLAENSWENEEVILRKVWHENLPATLISDKSETLDNALDIRIVAHNDDLRDEILLSSIQGDQRNTCRSNRDAQIIMPHMNTISDPPLIKSTLGLENWRQKIAGANGVIIQGFDQIIGTPFVKLTDEIAAIKDQNTSVAFYTSSGRFELAADLRDLLPFHPSRELSSGAWERYERQLKRTRAKLDALEVTVITTSRVSAQLLNHAVWSPIPVTLNPPVEGDAHRSLHFLIAPGFRGPQERASLLELSARLKSLGHVVTSYTAGIGKPILFGKYHFVIDTLGLGEYSEFAARAMGQGCIVIGGPDLESTSSDTPASPGIKSDINHLLEDVLQFLDTNVDVYRAQLESFRFASIIHGGQLSRSTVISAMSLDQ